MGDWLSFINSKLFDGYSSLMDFYPCQLHRLCIHRCWLCLLVMPVTGCWWKFQARSEMIPRTFVYKMRVLQITDVISGGEEWMGWALVIILNITGKYIKWARIDRKLSKNNRLDQDAADHRLDPGIIFVLFFSFWTALHIMCWAWLDFFMVAASALALPVCFLLIYVINQWSSQSAIKWSYPWQWKLLEFNK